MAELRSNIEVRTAALIIGVLVVFFLGVAVFSTNSRLVGGLLITGPVILALVSMVRIPNSLWAAMAQLIAKTEQERESRPDTGPLWMLAHLFGNILSVIMVLVFVAVVAYTMYRWFV